MCIDNSIIRFLTETPVGQMSFMGAMAASGGAGAYCFSTVNPLLGVAFGANYVAITLMTKLVTEKVLERKLTSCEQWIVMAVSLIPAVLITIGIGVLL